MLGGDRIARNITVLGSMPEVNRQWRGERRRFAREHRHRSSHHRLYRGCARPYLGQLVEGDQKPLTAHEARLPHDVTDGADGSVVELVTSSSKVPKPQSWEKVNRRRQVNGYL
jgi:hypothetical protein